MEDNKISVSLLPNYFLKVDEERIRREHINKSEEEIQEIINGYKKALVDALSNTSIDEEGKIEYNPDYYLYDLDRALDLCGKIAGVCYNEEGFDALINEDPEKTQKRIAMTINNGHHSVYDHPTISFNMRNIPKMFAMVLNNEHQYTTSEKSARYTKVASQKGSSISKEEQELYDKWVEIFKGKIKEKYGDVFPDKKIKKLAMENARYLVTVFMPTTFIYTTTLRQINYLASFMEKYINNVNENDNFEVRLANSMKEVLAELKRLNVLEPRLMKNEKNRGFSLFGKDLDKETNVFGSVYSVNYPATWAEVAQAQRHRTLDYQTERMKEKNFFIPPIISDDKELVDEWLRDISSVQHLYPQGELVLVNEKGKYEDFILKLKERLCSAAQLEINNQTKETLTMYRDALIEAGNYLAEDIEKYTHGARCTFPDFKCTEDCHFKEGKTLTRKI